jgi:predicted ATPase
LSEALKDSVLHSPPNQPAGLTAGTSPSRANGDDIARLERRPSKGTVLERAAELDALNQTLANAVAGDGGIAFVEAPTGVGKSRLLEEAAMLGGQRGMHVLAARGRNLEHDLTFGVALQLFENCVGSADEDGRAPLLSGSAALAEPLLVDGVPSPAGVAASLHGLYWLTANLSERRPVVLLVDDVHWCDRPSLRFLLYLAQRVEDLPVAAVFAASAGHLPDHDPLLDELRAHPATTLVRPRPLSADAVEQRLEEFLLRDADSGFAEACHEVTGGNPLLLDELVVELGMREVEPSNSNAAAVRRLAPESIAAAVLVRLGRLGRGAPDFARAVSVLGERVEVRHAAELAGLPVGRAAQLADVLMGAGVLRNEEGLSFVHPVVARALDSERPEFDRAEAHRRAASILCLPRDRTETRAS